MKLMYSEAVNGTEDMQSEPPAIITTYEDDNGKLQGLDVILYLDSNVEDSEKIAKELVTIYNYQMDIEDELLKIRKNGN